MITSACAPGREKTTAPPPTGEALRAIAYAETQRKLDQPISVTFEDATLQSALQQIQSKIDVNIIVDWVTLRQEAAIEPTNMVTLSLNHMPARQVLSLMLETVMADSSTPLTFVVREGLVTLTTRSQLSLYRETRSYNIRDLIERTAAQYPPPPPTTQPVEESWCGTGRIATKPRERAIEKLCFLIMDTVGEPTDWQANGGAIAGLRELDGTLVVDAPPSHHDKISAVLTELCENWFRDQITSPMLERAHAEGVAMHYNEARKLVREALIIEPGNVRAHAMLRVIDDAIAARRQ